MTRAIHDERAHVMDGYLAKRSSTIASGASGLTSACALARLTDDLLRNLTAATTAPSGRWALVALGGYGAGALLPASDIDLLLLSEAPSRELRPFIEAALYPLWDAGLAVGHQVRSPKDHLRTARVDLSALTATLTARVVAGDRAWGSDVLDACSRAAHRHSRRLLDALAERDRPGSPFLLEPDLKNGAGGRRDFDELTWIAAIITGSPRSSPDTLAALHVLAPDELRLARDAAEVIARARWDLHLECRGNVLAADTSIANREDAASIHGALADTARTLRLARERTRQGGRGRPYAGTPTIALDTPRALFELCRRGEAGLAALETAAWEGRIDAFVPGFRDLMTLRRPALAHTLTVGAHSLRCAALSATLGRDRPGPLGRSRELLGDDRALIVAALAHDAAKRDTGLDHPDRGAPLAGDAAARLGLDDGAARDASDLVRLHLALIEVATRDDLDSEDAILRAALRVGRRDLVAPLHLLSVADGLATGPAAWGPWHEALVGTLVSRLDAALTPEVGGAGLASLGAAVRQKTLALLAAEVDPHVLDFVHRASLRYLASREPSSVAAHARLVAGLAADPGPFAAALAVRPGPVEDTYEVAVATRQHPEALLRTTGALTLAGLDILSVDAYNAAQGFGLDVFVARSATLAPVGHDTWQRAERYARAALADRLELEVRLAERRRHYASGRKRVAVTVEIDGSAGYDTAVLVRATDRVGLLYDLLRAFSATGLTIRWAKAITADDIVTDTFHVVDASGHAPTDAGVLGHLAMRLRESA